MGNILRRGIEAYQQTMHPETEEGLLKTTGDPAAKKTVRPVPGRIPPGGGASAGTAGKAGNDASSGNDGFAGEDSKCRRVAKFLILIGGDEAAKILAELDIAQVEEISREIASVRGIGAEEGEVILNEFRSLLSMPYGYSGASVGGVETARRILYSAYGPEKGEALLNKTVPGSKENIFGFLEEFSPEQLALLLKEETPGGAALILSRLPSKLSAAALGKFPGEKRPEILRRIARQGEVAPEVLEQVAAAVREKARHIGRAGEEGAEIDGMQALAAILKQGDHSFGDRIISELEESSPAIGRNLKDRLYTLDDVTRALDRPLQEKLAAMSDRGIAVLLKGRGAEFSEKILSCVSAVRRSRIREEGEILGAVAKKDCDAAARDFLAWFRQAREEGRIILTGDEDVFI